ncbi:hypothetical protein QBA35_40315 [Streptomyces bottropensis]|uniref:Uncharacterized protein n=3 Tax=Streptomyces TaxID=1883 RepID=M3FWV4_9ACTN|nr:hypothetical protein SBD_0197 [Streptomyces bottropensis ATCC 25435]
MPLPDDRRRLLSALVVLRPSGEGPVMDRLTADRVHRLVPSPDVVRTVRQWFTSRGFEVGDAVGISFALTGPPFLFDATFARPEDQGVPRHEALSVDALPRDVARHISEIAFTTPPDFGPAHP